MRNIVRYLKKRYRKSDNSTKGHIWTFRLLSKKGEAFKALRRRESFPKVSSASLVSKKCVFTRAHQEEALRKAQRGENLVVSTGTGSGKTECFLLPILDSLVKEAEEASSRHTKITPGVRALIIYPMNALANDQMDRLRKILMHYPDITFGAYTGQTPHYEERRGGERGAKEQYAKLHGQRDDIPALREPLPNEILSREKMKENPPHILITNYAMLEYLLLRPEDNAFFSGPHSSHWRFVVLDEAHTYVGSTGIEVSMLLRRVQAALPKAADRPLQFFLTSATLGGTDRNGEIVSFARNLCGVDFRESGIVRAKRVNRVSGDCPLTLDHFYVEFRDCLDKGYDDAYLTRFLKERFPKIVREGDSVEEALFRVLVKDVNYWKVRELFDRPLKVDEACRKLGWSEERFSAFVEVASRAEEDGEKLFDARYHLFLRATQGIYISLPPYKTLSLTRRKSVNVNGREWRCFEAVVCSRCHALYLIGHKNDDGILEPSSMADASSESEAYLLEEAPSDTDDDAKNEDECLETGAYEICPVCGYLRPANAKAKISCGHNVPFVRLTKVKATSDRDDGRITKCIHCEGLNRAGILRGFFSGQEASTSVIATSLFGVLPTHEQRTVVENEEGEEDIFFDAEPTRVETIHKARQFIAFSDSRQAAAYFSTYLSTTHSDFLRGRAILKILEGTNDGPLPLNHAVEKLAEVMRGRDIVPIDDYLKRKMGEASADPHYTKTAWQGMLKELVSNQEPRSLSSSGLIEIGFSEKLRHPQKSAYGISVEEYQPLFRVLILSMLSDAAIVCEQVFGAAVLKDGNAKNHVKSFLPSSPGRSNRRLDYLEKVLRAKGNQNPRDLAMNFLKQTWTKIFLDSSNGSSSLLKESENGWRIEADMLTVSQPEKVYRCNKCHRLTCNNVANVCPTYRCEGTLEEIDLEQEEGGNHYYRMYHDLDLYPLRVVEHTAQLNKDTAYRYQDLFKQQDIDVLSCSTTFEMGVDVGELETVFMRNVPPTASNYAQRAGRAGRSRSSAAFAITFCNKSNHDFHYFDRPEEMIQGRIDPPQFKIENEKIALRHVYSSALSFFFHSYPEYFKDAKTFMCAKSPEEKSGYEAFRDYLAEQPKALRTYLKETFPPAIDAVFDFDHFGWVEYLFGDIPYENYPNFPLIKTNYESDISLLEEEYEKAKSEGKPVQYLFLNRKKNYEQERIISFLSRSNILPRYGFPVDTVSLEENIASAEAKGGGHLNLARDLSSAISDYAPGCEVIADGRLYTSRYIKPCPGKDWRLNDYYECPKCHTMNVELHREEKEEELRCKRCGERVEASKKRVFMIPEFGFVTDKAPRLPTLVKPITNYRSEAFFASYGFEKTPKKTFFFHRLPIEVSLIDNGPMVALNRTDFYVCPLCGYAEPGDGFCYQDEKIVGEGKWHKDSRGYPCHSKTLQKRSLGYQFLTDVARIEIPIPIYEQKPRDAAYSILQAILLAAVDVLNLDEDEISGALQYFPYAGEENYAYILYDQTPGGAGHVKRLAQDGILQRVLEESYHRVANCSCGGDKMDTSCYSCLRTYRNQKYHENIQRGYVARYLKPILDGTTGTEAESMLEERFLERILRDASCYETKEEEGKKTYVCLFAENEWEVVPQRFLSIEDGVEIPCRPDFVLRQLHSENKPIAVFLDGYAYHKDSAERDAEIRNGLLASDKFFVWTLTWNDFLDERLDGYDSRLESILKSFGIRQDETQKTLKPYEALLYLLKRGDQGYVDLTSTSCVAENAIRHLAKIEHALPDGSPCKMIMNPGEGVLLGFGMMLSDSNPVFASLRLPRDEEEEKRYLVEWNLFWSFFNLLQFISGFKAAVFQVREE